jgi:hypothetical protein
MRHGTAQSPTSDRYRSRAVTNRDRCNGDVMVPEMSDHHGMLEESHNSPQE